MDNVFFNVSLQQNAALEVNERKIQECERRIRQLSEELESRNQKLEVRLYLFVIHFISSNCDYKLSFLKIFLPVNTISVLL